MTETMKGHEYNVNIPGFCSWHFARSVRNKKAKRWSDGFLVLVRDNLQKTVCVSQLSEYIVWILIKSDRHQIYHVGFIYIPPEGSSFYNGDCPFDVIQNEITQKRATGRIILSGDWNSHRGHLSDNPENGIPKRQSPCERRSMDKSINSYGRKLIELCKINKMLILNGRANSERGNISDGFTCFKYNGSSTVDYTVAECSILKYIKHFSMLEKQVDSDHSPLSFTLEIETDINDPRKSDQYNTLEYYKWDPNNKFDFINSIESDQSRESFSDFVHFHAILWTPTSTSMT